VMLTLKRSQKEMVEQRRCLHSGDKKREKRRIWGATDRALMGGVGGKLADRCAVEKVVFWRVVGVSDGNGWSNDVAGGWKLRKM